MAWRVVFLLAIGLQSVLIVTSKPEDASNEDAFLRISGIDNNSEGCCELKPRLKQVGTDAVTGDPVTIDIGECRADCSGGQHIKRRHFLQLMRDNPNTSPTELFLSQRHHAGAGARGCGRGRVCGATTIRRERHLTTAGEVWLNVAETCGCRHKPHSCRRLSNTLILHEGTPLQSSIDVGQCRGRCPISGEECRPLQTRTVAVEGPNGSECVPVIEQCGCAGTCYRTTHLQHLYNYTSRTEQGREELRPTVQVVDVGRCVGTCDMQEELDQCVYKSDSGECLMSLRQRPSGCGVAASREETYTNQDGDKETLPVVTQCACL